MQRLGKRKGEIRPKKSHELRLREIHKLLKRVREMIAMEGHRREAEAKEILEKAKELGINKGLLLFRADDEARKVVVTLEVLKANDRENFRNLVAPDDIRIDKAKEMQYLTRDRQGCPHSA